MPSTMPLRGIPITLQDAQTTGNGLAVAVPPNWYNYTLRIQTSAGVSAGAVQLESASSPDYAGTWNPVESPHTVPAASSQFETFGLQGLFAALRARISTNIVGGTVTVTLTGY